MYFKGEQNKIKRHWHPSPRGYENGLLKVAYLKKKKKGKEFCLSAPPGAWKGGTRAWVDLVRPIVA